MLRAPAILVVCLWSVWGWLGDGGGLSRRDWLGPSWVRAVRYLCSLLQVNVECTEFIVVFFDTHPYAMMR